MQKPEVRHITIPSRLEELTRIEKLAAGIADELAMDQDSRNNLSIGITEAVGNAITHGNKRDESKNVHIDITIAEKTLSIAVTDEGPGFNPDDISDPLAPENMLKESGRGIFILRQLMDDVSFSFGKGTTLSFTMRFNKEDA